MREGREKESFVEEIAGAEVRLPVKGAGAAQATWRAKRQCVSMCESGESVHLADCVGSLGFTLGTVGSH